MKKIYNTDARIGNIYGDFHPLIAGVEKDRPYDADAEGNLTVSALKSRLERSIDETYTLAEGNRFIEFNLWVLKKQIRKDIKQGPGVFLVSQRVYATAILNNKDRAMYIPLHPSLSESDIIKYFMMTADKDVHFIDRLANILYDVNKYPDYRGEIMLKTLYNAHDLIMDTWISQHPKVAKNGVLLDYLEQILDVEHNLIDWTFASLWDGDMCIDESIKALHTPKNKLEGFIEKNSTISAEYDHQAKQLMKRRLEFVKR